MEAYRLAREAAALAAVSRQTDAPRGGAVSYRSPSKARAALRPAPPPGPAGAAAATTVAAAAQPRRASAYDVYAVAAAVTPAPSSHTSRAGDDAGLPGRDVAAAASPLRVAAGAPDASPTTVPERVIRGVAALRAAASVRVVQPSPASATDAPTGASVAMVDGADGTRDAPPPSRAADDAAGGSLAAALGVAPLASAAPPTSLLAARNVTVDASAAGKLGALAGTRSAHIAPRVADVLRLLGSVSVRPLSEFGGGGGGAEKPVVSGAPAPAALSPKPETGGAAKADDPSASNGAIVAPALPRLPAGAAAAAGSSAASSVVGDSDARSGVGEEGGVVVLAGGSSGSPDADADAVDAAEAAQMAAAVALSRAAAAAHASDDDSDVVIVSDDDSADAGTAGAAPGLAPAHTSGDSNDDIVLDSDDDEADAAAAAAEAAAEDAAADAAVALAAAAAPGHRSHVYLADPRLTPGDDARLGRLFLPGGTPRPGGPPPPLGWRPLLQVGRAGSDYVTHAKLQSLFDGEWLNDETINFAVADLNARNKAAAAAAALPTPSPMGLAADGAHGRGRVHLWHSRFLTWLLASGAYRYADVAAWVKSWTPADLAAFDVIGAIVHLGVHWATAALDVRARVLHYYDSYEGGDGEVDERAGYGRLIVMRLRALLRWYGDVTAAVLGPAGAVDTAGWTIVRHHSSLVPQQANGYDCGVFAIAFARCIAEGRAFDFGQADARYLRRRLALAIEDTGIARVAARRAARR